MTRHSSARIAVLAAVVALTAAACGSDSKSSSTAPPTTAAATTAAPTTAAPATTASPPTTTAAAATTTAGGGSAAGVEVDLVDTKLGKVLASGGKVLYVFEPDNAGAPTCSGQCAANWPPLKATGEVEPGTGLDAEDFATGANPDGFDQVTFYKWPLYFFAGDTAPGDVNGQGVGNKWWVVGADGTPIKTTGGASAGATTTTAGGAATAGVAVDLVDTKYGKVLASGGKVLYVFQPDNAGAPTCSGQCAANWPPLKATAAVTPGAGLDADDFATGAANPDGFDQVTFYKWPLYFFAGDTAPGDVNGQAVGGKWWVVGADGNPIMTPAS